MADQANELPPLPPNIVGVKHALWPLTSLYTADQMRDYARAALASQTEAWHAAIELANRRQERIRELEAALASRQAPEGWKWVPVETTPEMRNAGAMRVAMNQQYVGTAESKADMIWRDMLAASPSSPSTGEEPSEAVEVCYEAYQVVGSLLSDLGKFGTPEGDKILDNLSQAKLVHKDVLPWASYESASPSADARALLEQARAGLNYFLTVKEDRCFVEGALKSLDAYLSTPASAAPAADQWRDPDGGRVADRLQPLPADVAAHRLGIAGAAPAAPLPSAVVFPVSLVGAEAAGAYYRAEDVRRLFSTVPPAAPKPLTEWQPIETAPDDGRTVCGGCGAIEANGEAHAGNCPCGVATVPAQQRIDLSKPCPFCRAQADHYCGHYASGATPSFRCDEAMRGRPRCGFQCPICEGDENDIEAERTPGVGGSDECKS